ncbi:hypothetical protein DSO57_1012481 [Entomophthora muscae]|nr:hypothetical protein DSO57_1012481 [Entomophthora muscae]
MKSIEPIQACMDSDESDYRLNQVIGIGTFGRVYHASCLSGQLEGLEVAIKKIQKNKSTEIGWIRSRREGSILSYIRHPNIVKLYELFEDFSSIHFVLELCPYGNLGQYVKSKAEGRLPEEEVRYIMLKLIDALCHLHRSRILHRDIKCSNILIGAHFEIKLADFGLATKIPLDGSLPTATCGTLNYCSPELIERRPYSFSTDVWSLGCVLVVLLTGAPPFERETESQTANSILTVDYRLPNYVSHLAAKLVQSMLVRDPQLRISLEYITLKSFLHPSLPIHPLDLKCSATQEPSPYTSQRRLPTPPLFQKDRELFLQATPGASRQLPYDPYIYSPTYACLTDAQINTRNTLPFEVISPRLSLTLLPSGILVLWFNQESFLTMFSPDGRGIHVCKYSADATITDKLVNSLRVVESYDITTLPGRHNFRYLYASRQLDRIRRGAVQVEFISHGAHCRLWQNWPHPDFSIRFGDGLEITSLTSKNRLIFSHCHQASKHCPKTIEFNTEHTSCFDLPIELHSHFLHFQECLLKCIFLVKHTGFLEAGVDPICFDAQSFDAKFPVDFSRYAWDDARLTLWCVYRPGLNKILLPGVGWATIQPNGDVSLLFNDGCWFEVDPKTKTGNIAFPSQDPLPFCMSDILPMAIAERLVHLASLGIQEFSFLADRQK